MARLDRNYAFSNSTLSSITVTVTVSVRVIGLINLSKRYRSRVHYYNLDMCPIKVLGHSMSNQHKKINDLSDLDETWFLHSAC